MPSKTSAITRHSELEPILVELQKLGVFVSVKGPPVRLVGTIVRGEVTKSVVFTYGDDDSAALLQLVQAVRPEAIYAETRSDNVDQLIRMGDSIARVAGPAVEYHVDTPKTKLRRGWDRSHEQPTWFAMPEEASFVFVRAHPATLDDDAPTLNRDLSKTVDVLEGVVAQTIAGIAEQNRLLQSLQAIVQRLK